MSSPERIARLYYLLRTRRAVSAKQLQEEFEVSRATVMRDIQFLRDRLNAPIVYDAEREGYRFERAQTDFEQGYTLPGLWLDDQEAYALLTLLNVLMEIDPGILQPYVAPLRVPLKKILAGRKFPMKGFNRKIAIELEHRKIPNARLFRALSAALMDDKRIKARIQHEGPEISGDYSPQRLVLQPDGWFVDALCHTTGKLMRFPVTSIREARVLKSPAEQIIDEKAREAWDVVHEWYMRH